MWQWIYDNWLEIFGALTGLIYIFLSIKENILLWPVGLISCSVYIYVFFTSKFYADMSLQFYYVVVSIYGWYNWAKGKKNNKKEELSVIKTPKKRILPLSVASILLFFAIAFILFKFTDSPVPFGDSFTTSMGIIATWMLAKKYIEQWIIWIIVDLFAAGLYIYKELYPTALLYIIFGVMAAIGYKEWKKSMLNAKKQ